MKVESKLLRSSFIWKQLKDIIESSKIMDWKGTRELKIIDLADAMWIAQPTLSRTLNWTVTWSDKFFLRIWEAMWLSNSEMEEIFKKADLEAYKYKYWEDINIIPDWDLNTLENIDFENEELTKVLFKKPYWTELSDHDRKEIINFIKFKAKK